jgi:ribosome-binding protein aMBF1 (putative translation factor)
VQRFEETLTELEGNRDRRILSPRLWQAQQLSEQMDPYERLHFGKNKNMIFEALEDLPKALIQARIAAGMTQQGLAARLGVKAQQVQRYEATEYESASFARIRKGIQALGLRTPKPVRLVRQ